MAIERFVFDELPKNVEDLKKYALNSPFVTAALSIVALNCYDKDLSNSFDMINYLKGPEELSPYAKQFLSDRLKGKQYKINSFFIGSSPENDYTPSYPYTIEISDNPYSYAEENYATMYVQSSGADSPRPIKLRKKPSTGEWFLLDIQCLADIRIPKKDDAWA